MQRRRNMDRVLSRVPGTTAVKEPVTPFRERAARRAEQAQTEDWSFDWENTWEAEAEAEETRKREKAEERERERTVLLERADQWVGKAEHAQTRAIFLSVFAKIAREGDGTVNANQMREKMLQHVDEVRVEKQDGKAQSYSAMFSALSRLGVIVKVDKVKSTDKESGNGGHYIGVYRFTDLLKDDVR